jgi:hypothetical protein
MNFLLSPLAPYIGAAMIALVAFGGVQTWRIGRLKYEANVSAGKLQAMTDAKAKSEELRGREGAQSSVSYEGLAAACAARLPIIIKAGAEAQRITNAKPNPDGSRGMCDRACLMRLAGQSED